MSNQPPTTHAPSTNGVARHESFSQLVGRYGRADTPEGVSDELAALFLGTADDAGPDQGRGDDRSNAHADERPHTQTELKPSGAPRKPALALLVLGNLPVFAAAWASQYARDRQKVLGRPLGLLTLGDEAARLEVFGMAPGSISPSADLQRAILGLARSGADLLVRLPEAEAGWICGECHAVSLTILSGSDDPAIVGAYRSFKAIAQDLSVDHPHPAMRVAIAGCEEAIAAEAGAKLADATERFLGLSIAREAPVRRVDAGASAELYHGAPPAWADVPDLLAQYTSPRRPVDPIETMPGAGEGFEPRRVSAPAGFDAEGAELVKVSAKPKAQSIPKSSRPAPHALPEGLEPVDVACPYAREVGLAVDEEGVLHAVAWAGDCASASGAIRDLVIASSWLRDHADLVAVVMGRRLAGAPSVRHLVLSEARGALGLAQGELRLHVSAPGASALIDLN
jgi:hypothetical protein